MGTRPVDGEPFRYDVGNRVHVHIKGGQYNGIEYPEVYGWVTVTALRRGKMRDIAVYIGKPDEGYARAFTHFSVTDFPEEDKGSLREEAGNIADYLVFDSIENEMVARWVELLRGYARDNN